MYPNYIILPSFEILIQYTLAVKFFYTHVTLYSNKIVEVIG